MKKLFPGCKIITGRGEGSLTCFVSRNTRKLFALTAAHCVNGMGDMVFFGENTNRKFLGPVVQLTDGEEASWDAALIEVADSVARRMAARNFEAVVKGFSTPLRRALDPADVRGADRTIQAYHAGHKSELLGGIDYGANPGLVDLGATAAAHRIERPRLTLTNRMTRRGDSGGPIFTAHSDLVGFVSIGLRGGHDQNSASDTRIILAQTVLEYFGASLATLMNEATWRPAALPEPDEDEDPFANPFANAKWVSTGF